MNKSGGNVWFCDPEPEGMTWYEAIVIYGGLLTIVVCVIGLVAMGAGYLYGLTL